MRFHTLLIAAFVSSILQILPANAKDFVGIKAYNSAHPNYATKDVLAKSSNLRTSTDGSSLKVQLCVQDENVQRRLMHSGVSICIDPSGKKNTGCAVLFQPMMGSKPTGEKPQKDAGRESMPEPMPCAAMLICGCDTVALPQECAAIDRDDSGFLTFTAIIPLELANPQNINSKNWQIGIFSDIVNWEKMQPPKDEKPKGDRPDGGNSPQGAPGGPRGGMGGPGGGPGGMGGPGGGGRGMGGPGGRPGMGGPGGLPSSTNDNSKISKLVNGKIEEWNKVSYSDMSK